MNSANNASGIKVPCLVAMPVTAHLLGGSLTCSAHAILFVRKPLSTF